MDRCIIKKSALDRWFIVNADQPNFAWTGINWAPHINGLPTGGTQICNFADKRERGREMIVIEIAAVLLISYWILRFAVSILHAISETEWPVWMGGALLLSVVGIVWFVLAGLRPFFGY